MNNENKLSCRQLIGGLGAGIAASGTLGSNYSLAPALEDPTTKHPKPPFKEQWQP